MEISLKTSLTVVIWAIASILTAVITVERPDKFYILLWVSVPLFCMVVTFLVLDQRTKTTKKQ
jgi:hypothetical protein